MEKAPESATFLIKRLFTHLIIEKQDVLVTFLTAMIKYMGKNNPRKEGCFGLQFVEKPIMMGEMMAGA